MKPSGVIFDRVWRTQCALQPISRHEGDRFIRAHYLGKWPGVTVLILGLMHLGVVRGCIVFALPPRETSKRYGKITWELARLYLEDAIPANAETYVIGRAVRYIKQHRPDVECLVSYADPSVGHTGTIYRAANWKSDGRTDGDRKTPRFDYADAVTGKRYSRRSHVPQGTQIARIPRVSKNRYVLYL